jgi:DNA ligase-1
VLRALAPDEIEVAVGFLSGQLRQGRIGLGWAAVRDASPTGAPTEPVLTILDADRAFDDIKAVSGKGAVARRASSFDELLNRSTAAEQGFLKELVLGGVRQGALEGVMAEAIAEAAALDGAVVRRAAMLGGDLRDVARAALTEGAAGLSRFKLEVLRPLRPMLAQTAESASDALEKLEGAALEYKLDGARVQVHRLGNDVRVFTRKLHDVTRAVPEVVEAALALPTESAVLDGEVIALKEGGRPHPFQTTMRRFGRKLNVDLLRQELPLSVFFFDVLHWNGDDVIDEGAAERASILAEQVDEAQRVRRLVPDSAEAAEQFLDEAMADGHEGVMAKSLTGVYAAGKRGAEWLKIKPAHTLDLVVIAVEWGSGRRQGWLSNLHLACRDEVSGQPVMLGKTFKGMSDAMLAWQTEALGKLKVDDNGWQVSVRPELVVEVAFDGVQASPQYPAGLALRFARVKGYRTDKTFEEVDTLATVRKIFEDGRA